MQNTRLAVNFCKKTLPSGENERSTYPLCIEMWTDDRFILSTSSQNHKRAGPFSLVIIFVAAMAYFIWNHEIFLPPANEVWGKVMFLLVSLILFTEGRGSPSKERFPLGQRLLGQKPPWYWHLVVATEACGTHPSGMHTFLLVFHV